MVIYISMLLSPYPPPTPPHPPCHPSHVHKSVHNVCVSIAALQIGFVVPSFYEAITVLRIVFLLLSGLFGATGFAFSVVFLILNIINVNAAGESYIPQITEKNRMYLLDIFFKSSWRTINKRKEN